MKRIATSLLFVVLVSPTARAQQESDAPPSGGVVRLAVRSDSRLWIEGSSNLRDWSCEATSLQASIDLEGQSEYATPAESVEFSPQLRRVQIRVPVKGLKCGQGQMDRTMYKALRCEVPTECQDISGNFDVTSSNGDSDYSLKSTGALRVGGRENSVRFGVNVERLANGMFRAQGEVPMLMTDYGIAPPTALFGVIRTGNYVVVRFDLLVDQRSTLETSSRISRR
jgi:hypothetical protein